MEMLTKKMLGDTDVAKAEELKYDYSDENLTKLPPRALESYLAKKYGTDRYVRERSSVFEEASKNKISDRESILTGPELEALSLIFEKQIKQMKNKAKGGVAEQMELFAEGGLKDEGNTVDPVSGNDVPPGATQEEVRDDIPAQLSEGEFVFPADVVRYIGLEKLMNLRQEAKAGLARMEAMGQMGNADEATLPDDIPFTLDDLDTREETEDDVIKANIGTFVPPRFNTGQPYNPNLNPYQTVPTVYAPATGAGLLGASAQGAPETENRRYVNKETGQVRMIPFVKATGQSLYPIPEGFVFEPEAPKEEAKTTKVQTTKVQPVDTGSGDDDAQRIQEEEKYGLGGGRISLGGTIADRTKMVGTGVKSRQLKGSVLGSTTFGIGYNFPGGILPGLATIKAVTAGTGNLPEGASGNFTLDGVTITKSATVTNAIIKNPRGPEALNLINQHKKGRQVLDELRKSNPNLTNKQTRDIVNAMAQTVVDEENIISVENIDDSTRNSFVSAVMDASKNEDGSFNVENFNSLPANVQDTYNESVTQIEDEQQQYGTVGGTSIGLGADTYDSSSEPSYDSGYDSMQDTSFEGSFEDDDMYKQGGLASKKKPKVKKMKRGGLASKK